jgi:diacylglycerol O-acyltransferase
MVVRRDSAPNRRENPRGSDQGDNMPHQRLTATDASFLYIETPHEPQHVGSLSVLEGAPLRDGSGRIRIEEIRSRTRDRLHRVPRMRQKVRMVPFRQGRPVWVDDDSFDIEYHVRLTSLPRPGNRDQLLDLMGRLQSQPLDRARPLWEIWFVDGLEDDNVAQVMKVHHCVGDGIANVDMAMALVDFEAAPEPEAAGPPWVPNPVPSDGQLLREALAEQLTRPAALWRNLTSVVRDPARFGRMIGDAVSTAVLFQDRPAPATWNTAVSAHRRWVSTTASMEQVARIRAAAEGEPTLNDVVLAACTAALRGFMADRGEELDGGRHLKSMVPVSRRGDDAVGERNGNQVSLIVVDLPVHESDPQAVLEEIHAQTSELKDSGMAQGAETIVGLAGEAPMLAPALARLVSRQIPMNLVITNVPGPPVPLWAYGARVLEAYPYVEVIDGEGLTIAVLSYEGILHFGLTGDRDQMHDLPKLGDAIARAFDDLESSLG